MRPPARRWLIVAALFAVTYGISTPLAAYGVFLPVIAVIRPTQSTPCATATGDLGGDGTAWMSDSE